MKRALFIIAALFVYNNLSAQNVGINTNNPEEDLHLRTDSTDIKIRLDSKRSTNGFIFQSAVLPPTTVNQNDIQFCVSSGSITCIPWSNATATRLLNEDDQTVLTSDSLPPYLFTSVGFTNEVEVTFSTSSIPTGAIISGVSAMLDYDTAPLEGVNYGITGFAFGPITLPGINPYFKILDGSDNELIEYPAFVMIPGTDQSLQLNEELDSPVSVANTGNLKLVIPSFIHINALDIMIGLDKVALKVDYYEPVTGEVNSPWKQGVIDGEYSIESPNGTPFSIKENGVTVIEELRIPNGAASGHILTSNKKGKAFWKAMPSDNDLDWRIQDDTLQNLPIPTKATSKMYLSQGARLGSNDALPQAGDIRFDPTTGSFEGYTGAKWVVFSTNSGWGTLKGEEQYLFEKAAPKFKTFGRIVGLRGDNAMAVSDSSIVFYEYDANSESWTELADFLTTEEVSKADLFGDYAAVTFQDEMITFHKSGGAWSIEFTYSLTDAVSGHLVSMGSESRLAYGTISGQEIIIMERNGVTWSPVDTLSTSNSLFFLDDLEIKGDNLLLGKNSTSGGLAYHAILENGDWVWKDTLSSPVNPNNYDDDFGADVRIGGSWLAISARLAVGSPDVGGRVFLYKFNGNTNKYNLETIVVSPNGPDDNLFGYSIDISPSANYLAVSDFFAEKIFVFERSGNDWNHTTSLITNGDISDNIFTRDIQVSNDHIIAGLPVISSLVNDKPGKILFYKNE